MWVAPRCAAAALTHFLLFAALIKRKVSVEVRDHNGCYPLHLASDSKAPASIRLIRFVLLTHVMMSRW